ncbi:MAG: hypothetical protein ACE5HV_00460 [Acidobacteriota bacterium]
MSTKPDRGSRSRSWVTATRWRGTMAMVLVGALAAVVHSEPTSAGETFSMSSVAAVGESRWPGSAPGAQAHERVLLGADGEPLPFQSNEEVEEFLRTAAVVEVKDIPQGVTDPRKVLLEKDGVRMHAVFRYVDITKDSVRIGKRLHPFFRDSYIFECAAYELSKMLGLDIVPPAVLRKVKNKKGSLQAWVEQGMTEMSRVEKSVQPPDLGRWRHQVYLMRLFDNLVYNLDRNQGNILLDSGWNMWLIDHTRAFRRYPDLETPSKLREVSRALWQRLQELDEAEVKERLKPFLRGAEIDGLLKRRRKLVEHFQALIAERGEAKVLYTI